MEFQGKFNAKMAESDIRRYLDDIDLTSLLENELLESKHLVGYIEGPPTMNGEPHVGHLRGRIIKDLWYRFNTLQKKKVIFRAGWDTQGLPVELQAEKELGLTGSKADNIDKVGVEKIVESCKKLIQRNNQKWTSTDKLLGMSFDYQKAYWTFRDEYIEREWQYLKKAWESGILTEWFRVVAYCPSCQTSLSNAEVNQEYEIVEDPSFYYKVKLSDEDAFVIVWTTMPFTVVTDEMIAVNPNANYVYIKVNNEKWIVSESRLQDLTKELHIESFVVEKTIYGKDLEGRYYIHPLLSLIAGLEEMAKMGSIHFIIAEEFVDISTGSGIVHLSPANGEVDFEIAVKRGVPIFVPIDDRVVFTQKAGLFKDLFVRDSDFKVVDAMNDVGASVKIGKIKHPYPLCWRSHHKVVWFARREYFYMIEKLGNKPLEAAQKVDYFFESPKNRFFEIIRERVPWCISRERIWGTPLPIWSCINCGHKDLLSCRMEIVQKAIDLPDGPNFELHRPWVDKIKIKCDKCGQKMQREPFVLDTWHNSGGAPYASLSDHEYHRLIPAAFLTEGIDQTRGWAYTLLMENIILTQSAEAPFRSFLFQGHVLDENGNKMSKSVGNVIDAHKLLLDNSVDLVRFYFIWKSSPIESLNFSLNEMSSRPYQIVSTLYYLHIYFKQNSSFDKFEKDRHDLTWVMKNDLLDLAGVWLLSKLQNLIKVVTIAFERSRFHEGAKAIEEFIINYMSQTYVPITRNDIWDDNSGTLIHRLMIYSILDYVLKQIDIMLHPLSPFVTDYLYLTCFTSKKSILLENWPKYDSNLVNTEVEDAFDKLKEVVSLANSARMKAQLKRRWPIKQALICTSDAKFLSISGISEVLRNQLNVEKYTIVNIYYKTAIEKILSLLENHVPITPSVKLVRKKVAPRVKANIDRVIQALEKIDVLELLRHLQSSEKYSLSYEVGEIDLTLTDLELSYDVDEGYAMSERDNIMVFVTTKRDEGLTAKGLLRDLARNLQQLRKENGYNPTDILSSAYIGNLEDYEISILTQLRDELTYLVRVRSVIFSKESLDMANSKTIDLDGRRLKIFIE
jgi:isoleucyl-tRNA synthetase